MEPVGLDGQIGPFFRSNDPRSRNTPHFTDFVNAKKFHRRPLRPYLRSRLALTAKPIYFQGQKSPRACIPPFLPIFPVGPDDQTVPFSRSNEPRSRHTPHFVDFRVIYRLALRAKPAHFQGAISPEKAYPSFCQFVCAIVHKFLVIQNFDVKNI
ncbi:hypothetical protein H5410_026438 [Solanum commersonii]|uniref:Uncharacterized protein n=1 Tax=Solanum commersonii TaxID=4109 RepID=A0A9J5YX29_SOLCO|nr:hypothetical protein H5410_026438 [Solanum commersonii]